jgi:hypothetical protein
LRIDQYAEAAAGHRPLGIAPCQVRIVTLVDEYPHSARHSKLPFICPDSSAEALPEAVGSMERIAEIGVHPPQLEDIVSACIDEYPCTAEQPSPSPPEAHRYEVLPVPLTRMPMTPWGKLPVFPWGRFYRSFNPETGKL